MKIDKNKIIKHLKLERHPLEGGFFRRTYESDAEYIDTGSKHKYASSIYYMLTTDNAISYLHKNKSDIVHCYHMGAPTKYTIVNNRGDISEQILGPDLVSGQSLQLIVHGGDWKASELLPGDSDFTLLSEVVIPGFKYADNELACFATINTLFPSLHTRLTRLIKAS